jgi:hypothetical protein
MRREIVTLCGSTKFKDIFMMEARRLTLEGYIVLMPHVFGHSEPPHLQKDWQDKKVELDQGHLDKIAMSDWVYVINFEGYIGESTCNEIRYAKAHNIPVRFHRGTQLSSCKAAQRYYNT